ncbi:MAG TPA: hypothetical protein VGB25_11000 [Candidatus Binatia bacterium]
MDPHASLDALQRFAAIERLVAKVYFRFSHLFLGRPELRDFWWQMAMDEEQHACVLLACREVSGDEIEEVLPPKEVREKADWFESQLNAYLSKGTRSISVEKAFEIALEIEGSELDTIYERLLFSGGPHMAKAMEKLGVPTGVQKEKLKSAILRFSMEPHLRAAAEGLKADTRED